MGGGAASWDLSRRVGASHLGTRGRWGRAPSDAGPLPPLRPRDTGHPRAEERGRRRPWSGSSSGPCRARSTLSTLTTDTSHRALQQGTMAPLAQPQPSLWPWPLYLTSP